MEKLNHEDHDVKEDKLERGDILDSFAHEKRGEDGSRINRKPKKGGVISKSSIS